jgi:glycyl-tRNA synthetase
MPFAAAQIGIGFRNEIAPKNGLLRVREFCMAEIEHFVNPNDKSHPKFINVQDVDLDFFSSEAQLTTGKTVTMSIGEAVKSGLVNNETLGYFMARTQLFLEKVGVDPNRMRFRQHLTTEMAHYATDCWDMEIKMSYGWIECVGHADRACYDLDQHGKATKTPMVASHRLDKPQDIDREIVEPVKKLLGPRFKGDQKAVLAALEALADDELNAFKTSLNNNGKAIVGAGFEITPELVLFGREKRTVHEIKYTPSVIEPSFGIGRIMYAILEHAFIQRNGDEKRCVMNFKPCVAPIKAAIFPLMNKPVFEPLLDQLRNRLQTASLANRIDNSTGSVGRRYSRADELGIPFGITVDYETLVNNTVTVRDRNSMAQIRVSITDLVDLLKALVEESTTFTEAMKRFIVVKEAGDDADDDVEGVVAGSATEDSSKSMILEKTIRGSFWRPNPNFKL